MTHGKTSNFGQLVLTLIALMVLLVLTVLAAHYDLGIEVAMAFAAIKAILVGVIFMDLRRSSPLARLFAISGLFWLLIFFMLAIPDFIVRG